MASARSSHRQWQQTNGFIFWRSSHVRWSTGQIILGRLFGSSSVPFFYSKQVEIGQSGNTSLGMKRERESCLKSFRSKQAKNCSGRTPQSGKAQPMPQTILSGSQWAIPIIPCLHLLSTWKTRQQTHRLPFLPGASPTIWQVSPREKVLKPAWATGDTEGESPTGLNEMVLSHSPMDEGRKRPVERRHQ